MVHKKSKFQFINMLLLFAAGYLMLELCVEYKWQRLAIISTQGTLTEPVADFLKEVIESSEDMFLARHFANVSPSASPTNIRNILHALTKEARGLLVYK
jgi:hypothetical protein